MPDNSPKRPAPTVARPATDTVSAKPWWHSKTIWFNLLCSALGAAEASIGLLQPAVPVNAYAVLAFVLAVGNGALRVVTRSALTARGGTP